MNADTPRAPIRAWLAHKLSPDVASAIDRLAATDDAQHVAVMPDVHLSREVCIGTVLATSRLVYPNAVGGDIGCGMAAIAFDAPADLLRAESAAARLLANLPSAVPAMRHARRETAPPMPEDLDCTPPSDSALATVFRRDGVIQLGTLGRGNHFLEFQSDDETRLWLMVHSGSRAVGQAVRDLHLKRASRSRSGLWFLDAETCEGQAYLADAAWACRYARANRRAMLDAATALLQRLFGVRSIDATLFDCDHNHVRRETHFGRELYVHRKGACRATAGESAMIPGSMGSESYHVEGRGCAESLTSSSHGAGRAMSRTDARRRITERDVGRQLSGVWFDPRMADALREEAPSAYKDISAVMRAQHNLTRVVRKVRPVVGYKAR